MEQWEAKETKGNGSSGGRRMEWWKTYEQVGAGWQRLGKLKSHEYGVGEEGVDAEFGAEDEYLKKD